MSESGSTHFSRIPSFLEVRQAALAESKVEARIEELPKELLNNDKPQTLRGKITEQNKDGSIRVKTDRGDVVLKPEKNEDFPVNREIEIHIPKGSPPEQATVRPAPAKIQSNQAQPPAVQNTVQKNMNIPPAIPASEIKSGTIIAVTVLPPHLAEKITIPYTDFELSDLPKVLQTLSTATNVIKAKLQDLLQPLLYFPDDQSTVAPLNNQSGIRPNIIEKPHFSDNPPAAINIAAEIPTLKSPALPLRAIISQILASPLQSPIQEHTDIPRTEFSEIKIQSIHTDSLPFSNIYSERPSGSESAESFLTKTPNEKQAGIVIGFTLDRHFPVLQMVQPASAEQDQYYVLERPVTDLPIGTRIEFTAIATEQTMASLAPKPLEHLLQMSGITAPILPIDNWETLEEIQKVLIQNAPQSAQNLMNITPNANAPARILPAALFFIAAMRSGDIQSWLGDKTVDALKRAGKSDLLSRLSSETSSLSRAESGSQDWRTTAFPLSWQNEIHKVVIHYRKENNSGDNQKDGNGGKTRFVMDLTLSNIGKIQIDGLFQGNINSSARLDIILRTTQGFSQATKMEMRQIYKNALGETKITGDLSFQDQENQWVRVSSSSNTGFSENI